MRILRFILVTTWIAFCIISSNYILKNEIVISWLKSEQLSIYFVSDAVLLFFVVILLFWLGVLNVEKLLKIKFSIISESLYLIVLFLLIATFSLKFHYAHISRPEVGWFYKIPAGENIIYPRNEKNKIEKSYIKQ